MRKKTPFTLVYSIPSVIFDALVPPRPTQAALRMLDDESLMGIANIDGSLPYHDARVRALIWELKYRANSRAAKLAGAYMSELLVAEASEIVGTPLLIPMPMHPERRKERGFNQTEVLCKAALKPLGKNVFDYVPTALEKVVQTSPQQGLPQHKRLKNVKNSMRADAGVVKGRACIVVDDVKTTGASFKEAERALQTAGARAVVCIALAQS